MGGRTSVAAKVENLKKAGFPPAVTIVIILLSSPGFYEFFFNNSGDEAVAKVEVAYEVLRERSEAQFRDMQRLNDEIRDLRQLMRSSILYVAHSDVAASAASVDSDSDEELSSDGSAAPIGLLPSSVLLGNESDVSDILDEPLSPIGQKALPESLDDSSLKKRIQEKVSKK